jgi:hypothetical protein
MSLGTGSFNHFPHYAKRIRDRAEEIRHEDSVLLRDFISDESPVDTGRLAASWTVRHEGDKTDLVESDVDYALAVDQGHHTAGGGWVAGQQYVGRAVGRLLRHQARRRLL